MRITGNESECPRCHKVFGKELKFECPFCGGLIPKDSERCPTCLIDLRKLLGPDQETVERRTNTILDELIRFESSLVKEEQKRFCCPDCSWLLSGAEAKCPKCGRPLSNDDSLTCPVCMSTIRKDAKECEICGAVLRKESAPYKAPSIPTPPIPEPVAPAGPAAPKQELPEYNSHLKCPYCGGPAGLEATVCPQCNKTLVREQEPETPEETTDEALAALSQIAHDARKPRKRKLKARKATTVEKRTGGNE